MRKIAPSHIAAFSTYLSIIVVITALLDWFLIARWPLGDFRGVAVVLGGVVLFYAVALIVYRIFLRITPLQLGEQFDGSRAEFAAQVNILFYLMLFNFLIRTHFLPFPLLRLVHLALGAKLGENTYGGVLLDPPLTRVGANCILGHDAVLFAHAIEGTRFSLSPIVIGDGVTVGALAIIMSDVQIGDGAIVSAGAVVVKGTRIAAGEIWGGVPARRLREARPAADAP
jgi:acetyltransferase-like isoleucine patch superfamily enzyme